MPLDDIKSDGTTNAAIVSPTVLYYLKQLVALFEASGSGVTEVDVVKVAGVDVDPDEPATVTPKAYRIAGGTLTRPANATPYTAGDSVSDNATAGSVTANVVTLDDLIDAPFTIERIKLTSTDTGVGAATAAFEMFLYDGDPTANSGVVGGDNAAFSNKKANCIGIFSGAFKATTGYFSDGSTAWLVPSSNENRVIAKPASGTLTIWWQIKTLTAFTPSANSTTFIPVFEGFYCRA